MPETGSHDDERERRIREAIAEGDADALFEIVDAASPETPLIEAIVHGRVDEVRALLDGGAGIDAPGQLMDTPLLHALLELGERSDDPTQAERCLALRSIVTLLIERGADVQAATPDGTTSLHLALAIPGPEPMRSLLLAGARPGPRPDITMAPDPVLCLAAAAGDLDQMRLLLEHHPDLAVEDRSGLTPLMIAIAKDHPAIIRELAAQGAGMNRCQGRSRSAPLVYACECADLDLIQLLLELGADPSFASQRGSALGAALARARFDIAAVLRERGVREPASLGVARYADEAEQARALDAAGLACGAAIWAVLAGSAADRAGLRAGDVVIAFDAASVTTFADLQSLVARHEAGDEASCGYVRDGNPTTVALRLGSVHAGGILQR